MLEIKELIEAIETEFGVSAAAPVAVAAAGAGDAGAAAASEVSLVLTAGGDNKVGVIKVVREITGLGLMEAKALVDGAPKPIKEGIKPEEAEELKKKFDGTGATLEIK